MVACGEGRGRPNAKLEAHRRYADIQITVRGTEEIGYKPTAGCTEPEAPFDENKDAILFRDAPEVWTPLAEGMFAVYFPEDAHAPMAGQGSVRKAVIKVLL
jgi:YhcH/YjgK/YiaL family protein